MVKIGYIYKLCIRDGSIQDCYIGSTFNLKGRIHHHKFACENENCLQHNQLVYQTIRNNGGWINWTFIVLEKNEFEDKHDLLKRERHYIELLKPPLNKQLPTRTINEWREETKYEEKRKQKYHEVKKYDEHFMEIQRKAGRTYAQKHRETINAKCRAKQECQFCHEQFNKSSIQRHIQRKHQANIS